MSKGVLDKIKSFFKGNDDDNDFQISAPVAGQGHVVAPTQTNAPAQGSNQLAAQAANVVNEAEFDEEISKTGDNLINKFESRYQSTYSIRLSAFYSMLAESKKHGLLGNTTSFNNVLKHIALVYRMMRTSFTGDKNKNTEIYAAALDTLNNLISMCDIYISTHDPRTGRGQRRKKMVADIKSIAQQLLSPITTARAEFETLTVESQMLNSFSSILNRPNGLIRSKDEQQNRLNEKRNFKDQLTQEINDLKALQTEIEEREFEIPLNCSTTLGCSYKSIKDYDDQRIHVEVVLQQCKKYINQGANTYALNHNLVVLNAYIQAKVEYESIKNQIEQKNKQIRELNEDINPFSKKRKDNAIWLKRVDLGLTESEDAERIVNANHSAIKHFQDKKNKFSWSKNGAIEVNIPLEAIQILDHNAQEMLSDTESEGFDAFYEYTMDSTGFNTVLAGFDGDWSKPSADEVNIDSHGFGDKIRALTALIEQSSLPHDIWLQTGQRFETLSALLDNVSPAELRRDYDQLKDGHGGIYMANQKLQDNIGKAKIIPQFLSTTTFKGGGSAFNDFPVKLNIYAPAGAELLYAGDKGAYGYSEQEIILQRGGTYVIKDIYWSNDDSKSNNISKLTLFIDLELHNEFGYHKPQQDQNEWYNNRGMPSPLTPKTGHRPQNTSKNVIKIPTT